MKQFNASGSETASIPLKNFERVRGKWRQEAKKDSQEQGAVVKGEREKTQNEQKGDKRFENEGGAGAQH